MEMIKRVLRPDPMYSANSREAVALELGMLWLRVRIGAPRACLRWLARRSSERGRDYLEAAGVDVTYLLR